MHANIVLLKDSYWCSMVRCSLYWLEGSNVIHYPKQPPAHKPDSDPEGEHVDLHPPLSWKRCVIRGVSSFVSVEEMDTSKTCISF